MKSIHVLFAFFFAFVACKKREENSVVPVPNAEDIRLVEITDSNLTNKSLASREKYHYGAAGRVTTIELLRGSKKFEYVGGQLSKIFIHGDVTHDSISVEITRNDQGLITRIINQYSRSTNTIDLEYDEQGNLVKTKEQYAMVPASTSQPEETIYSDFDKGRWTKSSVWRNVVFHEMQVDKMQTERRKIYDKEGRLVRERIYTRMYEADTSNGVEYLTLIGVDSVSSFTTADYFEMSEGERIQRTKRQEEIQRFYTPNLDVSSFLYDQPIVLDYITKTLVGGAYSGTRNTILNKTNSQGLITETVSTGGTVQGFPEPNPMYDSKKIYRYENVNE